MPSTRKSRTCRMSTSYTQRGTTKSVSSPFHLHAAPVPLRATARPPNGCTVQAGTSARCDSGVCVTRLISSPELHA